MDEKIDFMQELYKIALNWLAKQAGTVIVLSTGIIAIWTVGSAQITKLEGMIDRQAAKIESQGEMIRQCDIERATLQVEVNSLRQRIELLVPLVKRR